MLDDKRHGHGEADAFLINASHDADDLVVGVEDGATGVAHLETDLKIELCGGDVDDFALVYLPLIVLGMADDGDGAIVGGAKVEGEGLDVGGQVGDGEFDDSEVSFGVGVEHFAGDGFNAGIAGFLAEVKENFDAIAGAGGGAIPAVYDDMFIGEDPNLIAAAFDHKPRALIASALGGVDGGEQNHRPLGASSGSVGER